MEGRRTNSDFLLNSDLVISEQEQAEKLRQNESFVGTVSLSRWDYISVFGKT